MKVDHDQFVPMLLFGFSLDKNGQQIVCQMWKNAIGEEEWRPLPMIEMKAPERNPAIAGYLEDEDC